MGMAQSGEQKNTVQWIIVENAKQQLITPYQISLKNFPTEWN